MATPQLHRYRVLESLGKGGSGEVFLGLDPFDESVAIKIQRRPRKRNRFMQEYKILNEFPHPSLVKVHEFGLLDEGWSYLILGLIEGKSATAFVRSLYGSERLYKCIQIAIKVSEAFGSLHQMGWIHGDIKSNNILVDKHGIPHLIDFELARSLEDTGQGKFFGTRSYAPPEQHEGKKLDATVDVYAMAGVLYRMITNKSAFQRVDNAKEAENRRITPPDISKRMPKKLKMLLTAALSPDPYKRPSNGYVFADMLRQCLTIPEPVIIHKDPPPYILHITNTLQNYNIQPEVHTLALEALTGGDASLVSRFVHHYSQHNYWVPDDYHEQVWHYLQHLPEETQRALYLLACIGGRGSTSLLRKFTNIDRRQLSKALEQLPHWVRKEGHMWHLYVGATHYACTHLIEHNEGIDTLLEAQTPLPKWAHYCIQALKNPEDILLQTEAWIHQEANTIIQWRLLQLLAKQEYILQHLTDLLIHRQNGQWLQALQLRNDAESQRLLSIFRHITPDDIPTLQNMAKSRNIDVWVVSHALLAEWAILHGHFSTAERWIKPLSSHTDNYPRLLGLQQRALLYHHLGQHNRLELIYQTMDRITAQPMTEKLRLLIANKEWTTNLFAIEEVSSLYLKVRMALEKGGSVKEDLEVLVTRLPVLERSMLSVHPLWGGSIDVLNLPVEPKEAEFRYIIASEDNL